MQFSLLVRLPGWARNIAMPSTLYKFDDSSDTPVVIKVNGQPFTYSMQDGYAVLNRTWKKNDKVEVSLPMEVRTVVANDNVKDDIGKIALQRGPLMYCAEWADNNGKTSNFIIPAGTKFTESYNEGLLNGITTLSAEVPAVVVNGNSVSTVTRKLTAIPYYSWANRGKGEMTVWFPRNVKDVELLTR